ncbi:MAG TPA: KTSC domain-containing protein [Chloroflexia bacterium]|nr:KTSC domain-containing protein [Chloroflexia bacterium]
MQREPFTSSTIRSAGYDPATQVLEIEFRNHRRYRYMEVPPEIFAGLRQAESPGAYFTAQIRNDYECWRLVNPARSKHQGQ